jgi:hypothetical protein
MKRAIGLLAAFVLIGTTAAMSLTLTAVANGSWTGGAAVWTGGVPAHRSPIAGDSVYIGAAYNVYLGGNQACGSLVVAGTLRANNTGTTVRTLSLNGAAITASGTISNVNGNINLTIVSPAAPILSGAGTLNVGNVTINAGASLTLGRAFVMASGTTLSLGGPVTLGANNLTITGVTVSGASRIVTNGVGLVLRQITASTSFTFPLGTSAAINNAVTLVNGNTTDVYGVTVQNAISPIAPPPTDGVNLTWKITRAATGTVTPTFNWAASQAIGYFATGSLPGSADPSLFAATDGTNWLNKSLVTVVGTSATMTSSLLDYGSSLGLSDGVTSPLPVQLASFKASSITSQGVKIEWQTASESNCNGFVVLRSSSVNGPFTAVSDFIGGNGTTVDAHSYNWTDASPLNGTNYYQLRQVDLDGHVTNYEPISVNVSVTGVTATGAAPHAFRLEQNYPNPFNPSTMIRFSVEKSGQTTLVVYNSLGQEVTKLFSGVAEAGRSYTVSFDGRGIASGIYFYRLSSETKSQVARMILVK